MSKKITLRIQSSNGTKRIELNSQDTYKKLYELVEKIFSLSSKDNFCLYEEINKQSPIKRSERKINLQHGDMIYLVLDEDNLSSNKTNLPIIIGSDIFKDDSLTKLTLTDIKQDNVDIELDKIDGKIPRPMNSQLCRHNKHGKCLHCLPIEPYDEEYLKTHNPPIKHLSFQSFIRKLKNSTPGEKNILPSLDDINCSNKNQCPTGHSPWPNGSCGKCPSNSMTLIRQPFRYVDNIMFENGNLVNRFLNYYRSTDHQRIGFLYGRYEVYDGVPLGVRARVVAIYEPPQKTSKDNVQLIIPDPQESLVNKLANRLEIQCIGWIFTDLLTDEKRIGNGSVLYHRGNSDSFFLTAQECIMAGVFQNKYPNVCKYSPSGYSGSKFVTVVVTGDSSGQIHFEGYQVSNQCMALVKAEILFPTVDAPELGYIKEKTPERYVPDIYYKGKDSYNNETMKFARPLPLEYLIIDVPTGFPADNNQIQSMFNDNCSLIKIPFSIENRTDIGEIQDMETFTLYLQQFSEIVFQQSNTKFYKISDVLTDFHILLYLLSNNILSFSIDELDPLLNSIRTNNLEGIEQWMENGTWIMLLEMLQIDLPKPQRLNNLLINTDSIEQSIEWNCPQCTLLNDNSSQKCIACSFQKFQ